MQVSRGPDRVVWEHKIKEYAEKKASEGLRELHAFSPVHSGARGARWRRTAQRVIAAVRPEAACSVDILREGSCRRLLSRRSFARERRPNRPHRARMHRQQSARMLE